MLKKLYFLSLRGRLKFPSSDSILFIPTTLCSVKHFSSGELTTKKDPRSEKPVLSSFISPGNTAPSSTAENILSNFFAHDVLPVPLSKLKSEYSADRTADRRSRFRVRETLKDDGAISNFYPLHYPKERPVGLQNAPIYIYEMRAFRRSAIKESAESDSTKENERGSKKSISRKERGRKKDLSNEVREENEKITSKKRKSGKKEDSLLSFSSPTDEKVKIYSIPAPAVWEAVRRYIIHLYLEIPPMVHLGSKIYTTVPLLEKALQIPPAYHDFGWDSCELCFLGKHSFCSLPLDELQRVVNKIVPWCIRRNALCSQHAVVHEAKGKFVSTDRGICCNEVRVYPGVTVQALFVDSSRDPVVTEGMTNEEDLQGSSTRSSHHHGDERIGGVVSSRDLEKAEPNGPVRPIRLTVCEYVHSFVYKNTKMESYKIEDASGVYQATLSDPSTPKSLEAGVSYSVNRWKVKIYPNEGNMRVFEFEKGSVFSKLSDENKEIDFKKAANNSHSAVSTDVGAPIANTAQCPSSFSTANRMPTSPPEPSLVLKIDAKGTMASVRSLLDDVRMRFGNGPYDSSTEREIHRALEGTPIVVSVSMQQGILRAVCCDLQGGSSKLFNQLLTDEARKLIPKIDSRQPFGLLQDRTLWPLQALHCCFDPQMKSWQDAAVSSLSLLPAKRVKLLTRFQKILADGLQHWGLFFSDQPLSTKVVSLLPTPQKSYDRAYQYQKNLQHPFPRSHPTTIFIVGILESVLNGNKEKSNSSFSSCVRETVALLSKYFKSNWTSCVQNRKEAVKYVLDHAVQHRKGMPDTLNDPNIAAIFITPDKCFDSFSWVFAECLAHGILPVIKTAPTYAKHQALLCGNVKRQLITSFETDPLFGVQLNKECSFSKEKYILFMGIDSCHTSSHSVGSVVGIFCTPVRNHHIPYFWKHNMRGSEVSDVCDAFQYVFKKAERLYEKVDEVVVLQDGDVFRAMKDLKTEIKDIRPKCGFTFLCLHKRGNIRFMHGKTSKNQPLSSVQVNNVPKGVVIKSLTPISLDTPEETETDRATPGSISSCQSFYLQPHDGNMSTARILLCVVHHSSPTLSIATIWHALNVMSNVLTPQPTKLPMPTRCAHRLASKGQDLLKYVPNLQHDMIPSPLCERLWYF